MIVQEAAKVDKATESAGKANAKKILENMLQTKVEACSDYQNDIVGTPGYHAFFNAAHRSFADHRPLILSPDMFWLLMAQGFAQHVNLHAEEMRDMFVEHEGQKTLHVRRDDFAKGSLENPWDEVFGEFSTQIKEHIGDENHGNIVVSFSTTGKVEQAANEVVLMESMKPYFKYMVHTMCGIPQVTLEGEAADWEKLRDKTEAMGKAYGLEWWTDHVHPIFDRIAQNAAGADDPHLWENFYKLGGGSGGPFINGWITQLVPYLKNYKDDEISVQNSYLGESKGWGGLTDEALPLGLCQTPFTWDYLGKDFDMEFVAGFVGSTEDENLALRPKIGWAVRDKDAEPVQQDHSHELRRW